MITFDSVSKSFGDEGFALQHISFTIERGELVVLTGPSGSGKTTLMRLLTREYTPTEGEIYFEDQPISEIKKSRVHLHRRKIGVVFQDYKLIPDLNVWENIALSLNIIGQKEDEIEQRVTDLLHLINLGEKAFLFPSQLSGGEAQRVSIARALATAPDLIFADEPTGNLDAETSASIARLLQKINKLGTTVMICTHDVGVLDLLVKERHMRLEQGQLVKDTGTHHKKTKETKAETEALEPDEHKSATSDSPSPSETKQSAEPESSSKKVTVESETLPETESSETAMEVPSKPGFKFKLPSFSFGRKSASIEVAEEEQDGTPVTKPETPAPKKSAVSKVTIENV